MPKELNEASALDGAGAWKAFRYVQIPLAVPALASLSLLLFLWTWNAFLQAIVLIDDPTKRTMAGALQNFVGQYSTDIVLLNAGSLLIMAPTIVVFLNILGPLPMMFTSLIGAVSLPSSIIRPWDTKKAKSPSPIFT